MERSLKDTNYQSSLKIKKDNQNNLISLKETEFAFKTTTEKSSSGGFFGEFYQIPNEEIMPIVSNIFQKAEEKETLSSSFYEVRIILAPKPEQSYYRKKKKIQKSYNTSHQVSCKTLNKNIMCVCVGVCKSS